MAIAAAPSFDAHIDRMWREAIADPDTLRVRADATLANAGDDRQRLWAQLTRAVLCCAMRPAAESAADLDAAAASPVLAHDARARRLVDIGRAMLLMQQREFEAAFDRFMALPLLSTPGADDLDDYFILHGRSYCASGLGRIEDCFSALYAAVALTERLGDSVRYCSIASNLAASLTAIGRPEECIALLEPMVREGRLPAKHMRMRCNALINLAAAKAECGQQQASYEWLQCALALIDGLPDAMRFVVHGNLADVCVELRRFDEAQHYLALARRELTPDVSPSHAAICELQAAHLARERGDLAEAIRCLEQARAAYLNDGELLAYSRVPALRVLSDCYAARGDWPLALERHREYHEAYRQRAEYRARGQLAVLKVQHELEHTLRLLEAERAFARARERSLRNEARRDALTGLYNRRYLDEALPALLRVARRDRHAVAVALVDLDHFKRVNDTHGHAGGDLVLRGFAQLASLGVRESDIACRYGGEEFCILLLECDRDAARHRMEALLAQFRAWRGRHGAQTIEAQSFSAGIACYPDDAKDARALLALADRRLYAAKQAGRARVVADDAIDAGTPAQSAALLSRSGNDDCSRGSKA